MGIEVDGDIFNTPLYSEPLYSEPLVSSWNGRAVLSKTSSDFSPFDRLIVQSAFSIQGPHSPLRYQQAKQIPTFGLGKNIKKAWKHHKKEIILATAATLIVITVVVIIVSSGGAAAAGAAAAGAAALDGLASDDTPPPDQTKAPVPLPAPATPELPPRPESPDFSSTIEFPPPPVNPDPFAIAPTVSAELFTPTIPPLFDTFAPGKISFLQEGVVIEGQFTSYPELLQRSQLETMMNKFQEARPSPNFIPREPLLTAPTPSRPVFPSFLPQIPEKIKATGHVDPDPNIYPFLPGATIPRIIEIPGTERPHRLIMGINGIGNSLDDAKGGAAYLKEFFKEDGVTWIYRKTHGIIADTAGAVVFDYNGYCPDTVEDLQAKWTEFHEQNKGNPYAKILQYGHSGGAIDIGNALRPLSKEIRDRVIVVAIAPGRVVSEDLCYQSYNYASERDLVPQGPLMAALALGPVLGAKRVQEETELLKQLIILPAHSNAALFDHPWQSPTFEEIIENHAKDYEMHGGIYK